MLLPRILTALVLIAVLVFCLFQSNPNYWVGLVGLIALAAWWEWLRLAQIRESYFLSAAYSIVLLGFLAFFYYLGFSIPLTIVIAIVWLTLISATLITKLQVSGLFWSQHSKAFIGAVVLAYFAYGAVWLKELVGANVLIGLLAIIWIADSGAYFTGKLWGKRKLAPSVSPGKSIEGMLGGLCLVVIYITVINATTSVNFSLVLAIVVSIIIAAVSVGGDLYESWLKRQANIKDSSHILPGHGGVLDRIDSLIAALPFMLLAATFVL